MSEQKGTKELTEAVDFALDMVKLGVDVGADKKVDMSDLGLLISRLPLLAGEGVAAFQGGSEIGLELSDLDAEESATLIAHVMGKLAVDDAKARLIVEKALKAAYADYELGKAILS